MTARACERAAKSTIAIRPRTEPSDASLWPQPSCPLPGDGNSRDRWSGQALPRRVPTTRDAAMARDLRRSCRKARSVSRALTAGAPRTLSVAPRGVHHGEAHEARPVRLEEQRAPAGGRRQRHAVDQHGQRPDAARNLSAIGSGLPSPSLASSSRAPLGGNMMRSCGSALSPARPPGGSAAAAAAAWPVAATSAPLRRRRQRRRQLAGAGEGIEQDRRRGGAPDQAGHRRAVGPADPDADGALAVEADRPGVAIAVGRAGLERDAAAGGILRRRRAEQHIADIPGGDRIEQPARRRRLAAVSQRARSAATVVPSRARPA